MDARPAVAAPLGDGLAFHLVRALMEALPSTTLLLDTSGRIVAANTAAARALGAERPDDLLGRNVFELLPPEIAATRREHFDRTLASGEPAHFDDRRGNRDLRSTVHPIHDAGGALVAVAVIAVDVTDQVRAESALHVSLEKYKVLFESFPLGLAITDEAGHIVEANAESERLLGLSRAVQAERDIDGGEWRIVRQDGSTMPSEEYASVVALRERRIVKQQVMGVGKGDGDVVWLNVSAAPIPLAGFGVAVTYGDITDWRQTEAALIHVEQKYRALFDHMAEGIALHRLVRDEHGQVVNYEIVDINSQYESIVGLHRDQVVNRLATEVYGTATPAYLEEFSSAPLTGRPIRFETYFSPMDKHFSISVVPLGPDGFATIFFDITALTRSLQEQEKLIALVESSNEFVGLATLDGQILYVNETARRLCGLERNQPVTGMTVFDFAPVEGRAMIAATVLPAVQAFGAWTGESTVHNKRSGEVVPVDISVFSIPSRETGRPMCLATVMRDITERTRAREDKERLEGQLRQAQKMESIGRLAGGIAHDFNNLLTSILGNVSMVLEDLDADDPIRAPLADVQRAGESAATLTRQLLAFSRKQIIEPKILDLGALIGNMERMLRRIIGEDVQLDTCSSGSPSCVRADAGQIEQVVVNLSVNAREAMPDGGHLVIETTGQELDEDFCRRHPPAKPGRYVVLAVSDTGSGMTDEVKAQAFEPFFTTKAKGTGLGLSMIYGAVTQHGGFVDLYSEVGRGTTVKVYLPAATAAAEAPPVVTRREQPVGSETILLVEDEDLVRELAQRVLARLGYTVLAHGNGTAALGAAAAHDGPIHLLLTDVVMPGMNGRELANRLQAIRPQMKTIFSSGYTDNIIVHHGLLDSGLQFIGKPYSPQALAAKVRSVLDA